MYKTIENSKKILKTGDSDGALKVLYGLLEKNLSAEAKISVYKEIAKIHVFMKNYTKAIEEIGAFFNDTEMLSFLDNVDEYITEKNKDRVKNTLLNNFEILKKRTILKSKPSSMLVELTNKCNLRCIMCESVKNKYIISDTVLCDIIEYMKYFERITCLGGEVFLYDKFSTIMENAKKYDTLLGISTNGLLLGKNIAMFENMKASIGVSVDGFDKNTYEKIRINGNFDVLTENLEIFKQSMQKESFKNITTALHMVIMKDNYIQVKNALDFALKYNFKALRFFRLNSATQYALNQNETDIAISQIHECMDIIEKEKYNIQIFTDPNLNVVRNNQKKLYNNLNLVRNELCFKCNIPWKNLSVSVNENVYFDCRSDCKKFGRFETIEKSWNSLAMQKIRQSIIDGTYIKPCNNCRKLI